MAKTCFIIGSVAIVIGFIALAEPVIGVSLIGYGFMFIIIGAILDNQERTIKAIEDGSDQFDRFANRYAYRVFNDFVEKSFPEDAEISIDSRYRSMSLNDNGNYTVKASVDVRLNGNKTNHNIKAEIAPKPDSNIRAYDSWHVIWSNLGE